ncbi:MAG: hypothetical protein ABSH44_17340 [Bryobacteraceae bacterium]
MRHISLIPTVAAVFAALVLSACSKGGSYPVRSYSLGEKVGLGHIIYTVYETQWVPQFGEGPSARVPQHRFFLVRMTAVNSGGDDVIVPNVTIENDMGASYPELQNGDGVPAWIGYLRRVKPAESAQGNLLFDVPPAHYKLRVTDEDGDHTAYIDIPLSFGAEVPTSEVPLPEKKPDNPFKQQ